MHYYSDQDQDRTHGPRGRRHGRLHGHHGRRHRDEARAEARADRAECRMAMREGMHRMARHAMRRKMEAAGMFGPEGPFGSDGPFGPGGPFGADGPFGGGGRRGGGGGGRRRKRFDGEELRLVMLKLIGDEPRHGYDLIREIETLTGGAYAPSPGLVYPTLTLLADMDLIAEQGEGGSRKSYAITEAGRADLETKQSEVDEVMERLAGLAQRQDRESVAPAMRAMHNLGNALRNKMIEAARKGGANKEQLFDIVEIIDEAARKIERL